MKKIKIFFSIFTFTILTIFVVPLFMSVVSLQPLFIVNPRHHRILTTEEGIDIGKKMGELWKKKLSLDERKRIVKERKMKLKRIEMEENKTLVAFAKLSRWGNLSKRYWLSPIMLGLKEVTVDKDGKKVTYKLDEIAPALRRMTGFRKDNGWSADKNSKDILSSFLDFTKIKGKGRQQLLDLLEEGTGKPLGIITDEKVIEYQESFLNHIRPDLIKSKEIFISKYKPNPLPKSAWLGRYGPWWLADGTSRRNFSQLYNTKNLEDVLYKNLDPTSKRHLIEIGIRIKSFDGTADLFHRVVDAFRNWIPKELPSKSLHSSSLFHVEVDANKVLISIVSNFPTPITNTVKEKEILFLNKKSKIKPVLPDVKIKIIKTTDQSQKVILLTDKIKEKPESLLQTKIIQTQPPESILTENLETKEGKTTKEATLQTRWKKTKLMIALSVTGGVLTFSVLGSCFFWFLKSKKLTFSLPCLQNLG